MDKIAVISDIHGNIPALEAVLENIEKRNIKRIFCLGDMIGKGPNPNLTVDIIKNKCEHVVRGNWDDFISKKCNNSPIIWLKNILGKERINYISNLPLYLEFYLSGKLVRLCHADPVDVYHRVMPNASIDEKLILFEAPTKGKRKSDILGYGDIHHAYIQNFRNKTLFNTGSVGNPLDMPMTSYVILSGDYNSKKVSEFNINIIRLPYDIEKAVEDAKKSEMPDLKPYIKELRTAIYRGRMKKL